MKRIINKITSWIMYKIIKRYERRTPENEHFHEDNDNMYSRLVAYEFRIKSLQNSVISLQNSINDINVNLDKLHQNVTESVGTSRTYTDKSIKEIYLNKISVLENDVSTHSTRLDNIIDTLMGDVEFINRVRNLLKSEIDYDTFRHEQRIRNLQLRSSRDYNQVMNTFNAIISKIIDNFILNKYTKKDSNGVYINAHSYITDRASDLNKVYDYVMNVVNNDFITEDLGTFYNLSNLASKEFIIKTYIEPIFMHRLTIVIDAIKEDIKNTYGNAIDDYMPMEAPIMDTSLTDIGQKIDKIIENN